MTVFRSAEELLSIIENGMLTPEERYEAGLALAQIGDPRPGIGVRQDGLPDIEWIEVPAGEFVMGSSLGDLPADINEMPQNVVAVPHFYISRYPITYSQYEAFMADGGYRQSTYWTEAGKRWRGRKTEPQMAWQDSNWHLPNYPVVGATWYEAVAFCAWLSTKLAAKVRLPGEAEWEKAARGVDSRRFPWGNQFYPYNANCQQSVQADPFTRQMQTTGIGRTTAAGIFPAGASPYGVLDMCGNVWEWTRSLWREQYKPVENNRVEGARPRTIRGGSWNERETNARAAVRRGVAPDVCDITIGFRICVSGV